MAADYLLKNMVGVAAIYAALAVKEEDTIENPPVPQMSHFYFFGQAHVFTKYSMYQCLWQIQTA